VHAVDARVASLGYLSWAQWVLGDAEEAARSGQAALAFADQAAHPVDTAHAYVLQAHLLHFLEDADGAFGAAERAITLSNEYVLGQYLWPARVMHAWARVALGDADGLAALREAVRVWNASGARYAHPRHLALLADACLRLGRLVEARLAIDDALAEGHVTGEHFWEAEIHRLSAALALAEANQASTESERAALRRDARRSAEHARALAQAQGAAALEKRAYAMIEKEGL
jgi:adenylate cyclase